MARTICTCVVLACALTAQLATPTSARHTLVIGRSFDDSGSIEANRGIARQLQDYAVDGDDGGGAGIGGAAADSPTEVMDDDTPVSTLPTEPEAPVATEPDDVEPPETPPTTPGMDPTAPEEQSITTPPEATPGTPPENTSATPPDADPDTVSTAPTDTDTTGGTASTTSAPSSSHTSKSLPWSSIGSGIGTFLLIFLAVSVCVCIRKRRRRAHQKAPSTGYAELPSVGAPVHQNYDSAFPTTQGASAASVKPPPHASHQQFANGAASGMTNHSMASTSTSQGSALHGHQSLGAHSMQAPQGMGGSNTHMHGSFVDPNSMRVAEASTVSSAGNKSLADVYQAAFPTREGETTFAATAVGGPQAVPGAGASSESKQEYVQYQIDSLGAGEVLEGLIIQQGLRCRLLGGQAVVQFAKDRRNALEYAIKFYLSPSAFTDEATLYTDRSNPLGQFLPEVRNIISNQDGQFVDAYGAPMAPCIAMEKGESLDIWSSRNKNGLDMITGLQVIHHIAERLDDLHGAGYCHRDLKPGNVMWLPRQNRWTLIDFGCAATLGEEVRMGYSLAYAAPEIIHAVRAGRNTIMASDKLDAWSLGVMAVELLTNNSPFNLLEGKEKVMDKITGVEPLPWEDEATAPALLRRFGHFKMAVMGLLQRDPEERPSMSEFRKQCNRVLMQTTRG